MAVASLAVRISAQIAELQKGMADGTRAVKSFGDSFEGIATRASAVGTFIGNIAADMARALVSNLGQAFTEAISLSQKFQNAFIGLSSVARAFGTDADTATRAARTLAADGLLPIGDAATGLKNLLAAGFSLPEATRLMEAFKDSAAFGRQGALSFGDAVRSATEGVKNGNSILVDNAGVTKNLSQILKEAGFSAQDLSRASTDVNVRMALYNGILKETAAQTGDALTLTQTYTGQVTKLATQYDTLLASLGDAITKNRAVAEAIGAVSAVVADLTKNLSTNQRGMVLVADAVIILTRAFSAAVEAISALQTAFFTLQEFSNSVFKTFSELGIALFKFQERAASVMQFLDPVNAVRHAAAIREAKDAYTFLEGAVKGFDGASEDARRNQQAWQGTLNAVRSRLSELQTKLVEMRGKTIELGESTKPVVQRMNDLGTASGKAAKAIKDQAFEMGSSIRMSGDFADTLADASEKTERLAQEAREATAVFENMRGVIEATNQIVDKFNPEFALPDGFKGFFTEIAANPDELVSPLRSAFTDFGRDLPEIIFGTLRNGGNLVGAIASGLAAKMTAVFQDAMAKIKSTGEGMVSTGQKVAGTIGVGLSSFITGFSIGQSTNKTKGALGGAAAGAVAGLPLAGVTGGASILVGAGIGALAGFFGGRSADKKAKEQLEQNKVALVEQFGGMKKLSALAANLGVDISKAFDAKKPEEFQRAVDQLNEAIERQNEKWAGLQMAMEGVNKKAELFADPFRKLLESRKDADPLQLKAIDAKLSETAQRGQAEFERLGTFVGATFAGMVKQTGDVIGAITSMVPAFTVLQEGVDKFGLTSTGTIDSLLTMFRTLNDEGTAPLFASLQATGQIFSGLQQAGLVTADLFQVVGADIGAIFRDMEAKGVDMSVAMALSQPILQRLWESQQKLGTITDETTQKILNQAEEQGLVGAHMKDVNQKILDVLISIADVFGAKLPDALRGLVPVAKTAADGITHELGRIKPPTIRVPVEFDVPNGGSYVPEIPSGDTVIELDGEVIARSTARLMPGVVQTQVG